MSQFRKLVEEITKPQQSTYTYLTPALQQALYKEIEKAMDYIDISELPSAYWDPNPYGVEPQLIGSSAGWALKDEDDLWKAACDWMEKAVEADGAAQYLWDYLTPEQQDDEEFQIALTKEAINYIQTQK
jgi:hypothetical protein